MKFYIINKKKDSFSSLIIDKMSFIRTSMMLTNGQYHYVCFVMNNSATRLIIMVPGQSLKDEIGRIIRLGNGFSLAHFD